MQRPQDAFISRWLRNVTVAILVLIPFHAFMTVWFSSVFGHYTAFRLWKELLLLFIAVGVLYLLLARHKLRLSDWFPRVQMLALLIGAYAALQFMAGLVALAAGKVTPFALGYAYISNLRFLIFFLVCLVIGVWWRDWLKVSWRRLLLVPASLVIGFGLLQFMVLPADFLKHFGYDTSTIAPYIAVDQKPEYARAQSTLRGPNPLGAYLVIIITAIVGIYAATRKSTKLIFMLAAAFIVLIGTYSRSAWLGVFLALFTLCWLLADRRQRRYIGIGTASLVIVVSGVVFVMRDNDLVQNLVFHTDEHSAAHISSNENRASALTGGLRDVLQEPLGRGPGTAGPASNYNDGGARLAENYFLQVGQEVGILGLTLFIAICAAVMRLLWQQSHEVLPQVLLASFIGLVLVNLLSHAWTDDTLAYVWWGMAGLAIGMYNLATGKRRVKKAV